MISIFLTSTPKQLKDGILIIGARIIPFAVVISIRRVDLDGSIFIASALSMEIILKEAPVSTANLINIDCLLLVSLALHSIIP